MEPPLTFEELFRKESDLLSQAEQSSETEALTGPKTETPGPAGEPWIRYTLVDRVGLAFSGGGIRSATFNLGVLKALHELDLLKHVDYLSTVSGGGYVGAWWSAWLARGGEGFPETQQAVNREPEEVRHLREFSNFLSPRIGFFESEMWNAIMAAVSAVLPAVVVASSVIALAFLAWLGINSLILADALRMAVPAPDWLRLDWLKAPLVLSVITIVTYIALESKWWCDQKAERLPSKKWLIIFWVFQVLMPALLILGICIGWHFLAHVGWIKADPPSGPPVWEWSTGISPDGWGFSFSPHLFAAPILWAGVALSLLVPRLLVLRFCQVSFSSRFVSAMDRALSRILGSALVVAALGAMWLAGCWLNYTHWGTKMPAGGALLSGGAFALLRNWIGRLGPAKKGGVIDIVKPLIPQILAYVAIALWSMCIAALLAGWIKDGFSPWKLFAIALGIIVFAVFSFDPAQVSMHSFYRNRLARAYLGASNNDAEQSSEKNRQTDVRVHDDIELRHLSPKDRERPIHLVCCAANDLGGDQLGNLSRGARSAVLSRFGFAIGNYCHTWEREAGKNRETLGLASAITASAAAFNSNMGSLSMTLGAGVTFLCSALNLRLGLWLPHPLNDKDGAPKAMPGLLFLKEMFGLTKSGLRVMMAGHAKPVAVAKYVHLSDGGHFEDLALYELVRRHCRYIIVSDCGADPEVAFDDFGNAVRRIREDFGVEIEVDLAPLKPNATDRLSKQHVAVGSISYDPRGDQKDTGILLYFKPTLTGDEPCDIAQYKARNEDFPHETTGDQFYDEAQWESYRRLGEHAARSALHFVERRGANPLPDAVFNDARWEWYQSPDGLDESIVELTSRLTALERQLREEAPLALVREMYPELQTMDQEKGPVPPMTAGEMRKTLHFLVQIIQLMEDVWLNCHLETHWNHPNNLGWMNTFQRWAYTPSFRLWWPLLKSMYGSKFRRFMEERLDLADEDYPPTMAKVNKYERKRPENKLPDGLAQIYWKRMNKAEDLLDKTIYSYDLDLLLQRQDGKDDHRNVQAGLAFLDLRGKPTARWTADEFFVPPGLWGAGLGGKFLYDLLKELTENGFNRCEVTLEPPTRTDAVTVELPKRTDLASRQQRNDLLAFYQRAGFELDDAKNCLVRGLEDIKQEMSRAPRPPDLGR